MEPFDWAARFESRVRELLLAGNGAPLIAYEALGVEGIEGGSVSLLAVWIG